MSQPNPPHIKPLEERRSGGMCHIFIAHRFPEQSTYRKLYHTALSTVEAGNSGVSPQGGRMGVSLRNWLESS